MASAVVYGPLRHGQRAPTWSSATAAVSDDGVTPAARTPTPPREDVESYARGAARLRGLSIDEAWWPGVLRHLTLLLDLGDDVESHDPLRLPAPRASASP
jgi:hypothetical protein